MSDYIIPILLLALFIYAIVIKAPVYDYFVSGAKGAIPLVVMVFPYLVAIFFMTEIMNQSGIMTIIEKILSPILSFVGAPTGITKLVIFRPFSGSGSIAIMEEIFTEFGADSYEGLVASTICGASETIFYLVAVYFSSAGIKKIKYAIPIAMFSIFFTIIVASIVCRFFV